MRSLPIFTSLALACGLMLYLSKSEPFASSVRAQDDPGAAVTTQAVPATPDPGPGPAPDGLSETQRATQLVQEARKRLYEHSSVQAQLRETVSIGDRRFRAEGTYIAGSFPKLSLQLAIEVGGTSAQLVEVCDGQLLWTIQKLAQGDEPAQDVSITRTVIQEVIDALNEHPGVAEAQLVAGLGLGGLPALMSALERSMTFDAMREDSADGRTYSVVQGKWNESFLARLRGGNDEETPLPDYVPDRVRLYIDQQTLFPARILYLRRTAPDKPTYTPMLALDFTNIELNAPVNEDLFRYVPSDQTKVRNRTSEYVQMIEAVRQAPASGSPASSIPTGP